MNLWIRFETMFSRVFTFKPENRSCGFCLRQQRHRVPADTPTRPSADTPTRSYWLGDESDFDALPGPGQVQRLTVVLQRNLVRDELIHLNLSALEVV